MSIRNILIVVLLFATGNAPAQSRIVFFKGYVPFASDIYNHKVRITYTQEGQYARPHTIYSDKYATVGKLRVQSVVVYDYIPPTPAFYIGRDKRDTLVPTRTVQLINVKNKFSLFTPRFVLENYTDAQFREMYNHKKWLRKKLLKNGYASAEALLKIELPEPIDK